MKKRRWVDLDKLEAKRRRARRRFRRLIGATKDEMELAGEAVKDLVKEPEPKQGDG